MKVIIAAAGTGGHINPGIAIANKIKEEEPNSEIMFIGTKKGIENDLVPRAGYELKTIESYGFSSKISIQNIKKTVKTIVSVRIAKKIIREFQPDIIIGTGGYICISVCGAAKGLHVPYIIHESNVLPGKATKILAKNSQKILVGFKEAKDRLPIKTEVAVTGTPIKSKNLKYDKATVELKKQELGVDPKKPLVLVFGGSQGSRSINNAVTDIVIDRLKQKDNTMGEVDKSKNKIHNQYQIIWATGPSQYDIIKEKFSNEELDIKDLEGIKVMPYIYNMGEIMNIADLIVCRSGAMTVTELEMIGKAAILIPYPYAAENHQEYNARVLENEGAGRVILDKELSGEKLNNIINDLVSQPEKLKEMSQKSESLSIKNVENKIYTEIKDSLNKLNKK